MEVRDVIPSQNQFAMQKHVEAPKKTEVPNERFKDLMNRKFSDYGRRQDSSPKAQEPKPREDVKVSEPTPKPHQKGGTSSEQSTVEETKEVLIELDSEKKSIENQESADKVKINFLSQIYGSSEIPQIVPHEEETSAEPAKEFEETVFIPAVLTAPVEGRKEEPAVTTDEPYTVEEKAVSGLLIETNRANIKQFYEIRDAGAETEYARMLEILGVNSQKNGEFSAEEVSEGEALFAEVGIKPELEVSKPQVQMQRTDDAAHEEEPGFVKAEWKIASAGVDEVELKTEKDSNRNLAVFMGKTEAVRHHENMTSVTPRSVMKQVVEAIAVDVKVLSDGKVLEVRLSPEHLGKVVMKIEMKEGQMVANIKVENSEVKNALEASLQELRETLSQKGVSVKEINVSVSKDEHRGGQEYSGNSRKHDRDEEESNEFRSLLEGQE